MKLFQDNAFFLDDPLSVTRYLSPFDMYFDVSKPEAARRDRRKAPVHIAFIDRFEIIRGDREQ